MSIEARNRLLPDWFTRIRTHQTVLPRFQRYEAWGHANVTQLFNTILRGLPVGSALVLEIGNQEPFVSRPLKGAPDVGERVTEHLLDGQQRLTALWRALHNNYDDRTYFLYLEQDEETGAPHYVGSISRWRKPTDTEARPFWANSPKELWKRRMVPLQLLAPDIGAQQALRDWAKEAIADQDERDALTDRIAEIRQKFATFNLPFMSLPASTDKETALDVFIKMNTSAAPLTIFDIVVAQVEAGLGTSLHELVAEVCDKCPAIQSYYNPDELALYASALLQGRAPTNQSYLARDFGAKLVEFWDTFLNGLVRTVDFLEQERIFDAQRLPTDVVVPVLVALWGRAPSGLDAEGRARTVLRRYVWRSFFCDRYEKSTNTRALADFTELRTLVEGTGSGHPPVFDNDLHPLPQVEELLTAGWPVRKDRLARAALALALRYGGLDLADGSTVTRANLTRREYHHLFPVAHLTRQGVPDERIFRSLNCALVTWRTNRNIKDKDPERYLAERRDGTDLGEQEVRARLASHLVPYDQMVAGEYDTFLATRAAILHGAMSRLCTDGSS